MGVNSIAVLCCGKQQQQLTDRAQQLMVPPLTGIVIVTAGFAALRPGQNHHQHPQLLMGPQTPAPQELLVCCRHRIIKADMAGHARLAARPPFSNSSNTNIRTAVQTTVHRHQLVCLLPGAAGASGDRHRRQN